MQPVAPLDDVLATIEDQAATPNKLAWSAVRPVLVALREYWEAGGFATSGIAVPAILHALPPEHEAMFRATIRQLVAGNYLTPTSTLSANDIPMEVALAERAHTVLDGWPGAAPEDLVDNLLEVLTAEAAAETDEVRKRRPERVLDTVKELGVATASEVLSKVLLGR